MNKYFKEEKERFHDSVLTVQISLLCDWHFSRNWNNIYVAIAQEQPVNQVGIIICEKIDEWNTLSEYGKFAFNKYK